MPIERYDPAQAPDPTEWLALDESERRHLVSEYHEETDPDLQRIEAHSSVHVIVENQIAEGDAIPVKHKARQLMAQGLSRHDAIHAIGSVLMEHIARLMRSGELPQGDPNERYYSALKRLNAHKWRRRQ